MNTKINKTSSSESTVILRSVWWRVIPFLTVTILEVQVLCHDFNYFNVFELKKINWKL
jgi:hypothetical protein